MKILPSSSLDSDKQPKTSSEIKPLRELPSSALKHHTGRSSFELETGWLSHWEQTSRYHCHSCVMQVFLVGAQGPVCCRLILDVLWEDPQYLRLAEIWETTEIQPQTLVAAVSSFSHSRLLGSLISDGSVSPPGQWKARAKQDGCGEQQQVMHCRMHRQTLILHYTAAERLPRLRVCGLSCLCCHPHAGLPHLRVKSLLSSLLRLVAVGHGDLPFGCVCPRAWECQQRYPKPWEVGKGHYRGCTPVSNPATAVQQDITGHIIYTADAVS